MDWIILIVITSFLLGFQMIVSKKALFKYGERTFLLYMNFFIAIFSYIFYFDSITLDFASMGIMFLKALNITWTWLVMYYVVKNCEISLVAPFRNLSSLVLIGMSYFILGETLTYIQLIGSVVVIFGALLLGFEGKEFDLGFFKTKYFFFLFLSFIGNSISAMIDRVYTVQIGLANAIFYFYFFAFLIFVVLNLRNKEVFVAVKDYKMFMLIGFVAATAEVTYQMAVIIPTAKIGLVITAKRLSGVFAAFFGGRLFNETRYIHRSAMALMMVLGIYLMI